MYFMYSLLNSNCSFYMKFIKSKYCKILFCINLSFFFVEMSSIQNEKMQGQALHMV
jgi:hypothetical protein